MSVFTSCFAEDLIHTQSINHTVRLSLEKQFGGNLIRIKTSARTDEGEMEHR